MRKQQKIRVLMVGPDRSVHGGISGVVNNYYETGLDQKIDLCYVGTMVEGSKARKLLKALTAFVKFCVLLPKYSIVHVNVASDSSFIRKSFFVWTAHFFHKKIVLHQHGGNFEEFYDKQLDEPGRRRVDRVLSVCDVLLVLAPPWKCFFGRMVEPEKILVFPDTIKIPPVKTKEYGQYRILFLGRLCREKGVEELLEAVKTLEKEFPAVQLYLGGIWEDRELQKKAEENTGHVTWIGWVSGEDKKKYLSLCDIFALPSYFEGQSVSILEAMAYSCAIVASDTGGIPQMITSGETGLLCRPQNTESLTDQLRRLLTDAALCKRLGENAYHRVSRDFSIDRTMEQLLEIYERICEA